MSDLVAFLNARLDEDEVNWEDPVRRWPPAPERALREVEAKRRILAEWEATQADNWHLDDPHDWAGSTLNLVLGWLAAVYGDHPDYDPTWS